MNKLLTLVIPTYNMEAFLPDCLNTLIVEDELMPLLEVLIIIDGSTDQSAQIGQEFADRYPDTFRVIIKSNGNYGSCVNRGIDEAQGKYIKTIDADDKCKEGSLQLFLRQISEVDADMIISDYAGWNMQTGHIDHFHAVAEGRLDGRRDVGRGDEKHVREVVVNVEVVVMEGPVLLRVKRFQQRG